MKVNELIAELQKLDPQLEVWVATCCDFNRADSIKIHEECTVALIDASEYNFSDRKKELAIEAAFYAQEKHKAQKRKYTGEPYFNHCEEVANIVRTESKSWGNDEDVIAAAYLHDVVEDTDATIEDIKRIFGKRISQLVSEVTDISKPSDGNRKIRKEIDKQHLAAASAAGQTIKLADLISNSKSIAEHDLDFARVYLAEKEKLLEILTKGDRGLFDLAYKTLQESQKKLIQNTLQTP